MTESELGAQWTEIIAPTSGDVRSELVSEAADFLGISVEESWRQLRGAGERFNEEWTRTVTDPMDPATLMRFYNQSDTELFELIEWHASDPIHYRTLLLRDRACERPGRSYLDYGSGIGNDALVFAHAGFEITLADVSDCLLTFAAWRLRRRGFTVRTIDLKRDGIPADAFDLVTCFDVLEHIPQPLEVVRRIRSAMHRGGLLAIHAPFGADAVHPMHIVHRDVVTPRMRSLGFRPVDSGFPRFVWPPQIYENQTVPALERVGYLVYDQYLNNALGAGLAAIYRRTFRRAAESEA